MGDEASGQVDVVIFFDANMPKMDRCSNNCQGKDLVFCKHQFNFNVHLTRRSKSTNGLSDFEIVRYFFNLIKYNWPSVRPRPLFILVTRDYNFIEDVKLGYLDERQDNTANIHLAFAKKSIKSEGLELLVVTVRHKPCGADRDDDLRDMVDKLNRLWTETKTQDSK